MIQYNGKKILFANQYPYERYFSTSLKIFQVRNSKILNKYFIIYAEYSDFEKYMKLRISYYLQVNFFANLPGIRNLKVVRDKKIIFKLYSINKLYLVFPEKKKI